MRQDTDQNRQPRRSASENSYRQKSGSYRPGPSGQYVPPQQKSGSYRPGPSGQYVPQQQKSGSYRPGPSGQYVPQQQKIGSYRPGPSGQYVPQQQSGNYRPGQSGPYEPQQGSGSYRAGQTGQNEAAQANETPKPLSQLSKTEQRKIRAGRSPGLRLRIGAFWNTPDKKRRLKLPVLIAGVLLICLVVGLFLNLVVYRVADYAVIGCSKITQAYIVETLCGIHRGDSIFKVREDQVKAAIDANRYLVFERMEFNPWNVLTITVHERSGEAIFRRGGDYYLIDRYGMVLETSAGVTEIIPADDESVLDPYSREPANIRIVVSSGWSELPEVTGIATDDRSGDRRGTKLTSADPNQLEALRQIILYMKVFSLEGEITEIRLSNMSRILLKTKGGFSVNLGSFNAGDSLDIRRKMKSLVVVLRWMQDHDISTGTIDVSAPVTPAYVPEA